MAFVALNGFDVEHASSMLVQENLFPLIQHINGKGVTDTYTKTSDVDSVTYIDVMRVLPYAPTFRQLGATNNGKFHNENNEGGYRNSPQSTKFTIPVDLIYDEGIQISSSQVYSNPINLKQIVLKQVVQTAALSINVITFAKQIEAYFQDNFTETTSTEEELAKAVYACDKTLDANKDGSYADAFIAANADLTDGIPEIGAFQIPLESRQAFITPTFDRVMKRQYMQNASEAATRILANGYINPFTGNAETKINSALGLAGMYDGVDLFLYNSVTHKFVELALGLKDKESEKTLLAKMRAFIVYGEGTCRGIVGPAVEANKNPYFGGVYVLPRMKVGVKVISGKSIKMIVEGGWETTDIDSLRNAIKFTPIDGKVVKGSEAFATGVFNNGETN